MLSSIAGSNATERPKVAPFPTVTPEGKLIKKGRFLLAVQQWFEMVSDCCGEGLELFQGGTEVPKAAVVPVPYFFSSRFFSKPQPCCNFPFARRGATPSSP